VCSSDLELPGVSVALRQDMSGHDRMIKVSREA